MGEGNDKLRELYEKNIEAKYKGLKNVDLKRIKQQRTQNTQQLFTLVPNLTL